MTESRPADQATLDAAGRAAVQALSDAIGGIAGVVAVDVVLQLIVDRVRELVGARYAALGILGEDRRRIFSITCSTLVGSSPRINGGSSAS